MENLDKNIIGKGEVKGFLFTQIQKSDKAYVYKINTGKTIHYEVFEVVKKTNSKRHSYPTSKAFGIWAWTFKKIEKAIEKFNFLNYQIND